MDLVQLIYLSRPFGFDGVILDDILITSRRKNPGVGVTGALICRADLYLQLLEGPRDAVEKLFGRIARDDRHLEIERRVFEPISARVFPDWAMLDDPARSWMWTQAEVSAGAAERAGADDLRAIFARVAAEPLGAAQG
jgi:hypothetical protein